MRKPMPTTYPPLPLGTKTEWGEIVMIGWTGGERYYWMVDEDKIVSMIPAFMVEQPRNP